MLNSKFLCGLLLSIPLQAWTTMDEQAFEQRRQQVIQSLAAAPHGSIAYEYEKNSYPRAIARWLAGEDDAIAFLEQPDPQAVETGNIDLYSGFTLKVQMRKYFAVPLNAPYRRQVEQAFRQVTAQDPVQVEANTPRKFWENSQDDCTSLVDCRGTENLQVMVETSVYLMAEVVGNTAVQQQYAAQLRDRADRLFSYGLAEWNSSTYLGHGTTAWLNLYDYARDAEMKAIAQQVLDYYFETAALKYWRGTWGHPSKRYGGNGAARFFWLYFGQAPQPKTLEPDWIHAVLSTYRPSARIMEIAQRTFEKPWRVERVHANYPRTQIGFHETIIFGENYELAFLQEESGLDWTSWGMRWWNGERVLSVSF